MGDKDKEQLIKELVDLRKYILPPILLAFSFYFYQAVAISIFIVIALSVSASLVYYRVELTDWKLTLIIEPLTAIMSLIGGYYSSFI